MSFTPFKFGQSQPAATTGFGGFGQNTSTTPAFGRPATGAFGQPTQQQASPFGGGGTFGAPANTAPAFGAPAQNTSTGFGGFGASQPTNTGFSFGSNTNQAPAFGTAFGQSTQDVNSEDNPVTTVEPPQGKEGTSKAPQHPKNGNKIKMWRDMRKDEKGSITGEKLYFDNICALPQYWRISPEELRAQDYADGRKQPAPTGGLFGQPASTGFGQQPQQNAFGAPSTSAFGAPANTTGGLFGGTSSTTGGFGTSNTAFGAPKPAFGAQSTSQQPFSFGQNSNATTAPAFGTNTASTNPFGSTTAGGFGQTANKPFGGFGATNTNQPATTGFGASASTLLGQPAQQTGFAGTSAFGGTGSTGGAFSFGKPATTGAFGQPSTTDNKAPFSFGGTNTTTQPSTGGFSFGQSNQAATPFGANPTNTGTSAFGQPQQQQNGPLGGGFGGSGGGFSFGQNQQNKPATGGFSFGNTSTNTAAQPAQPAPFSFGNTTQPAANNTGTTSTFGGFGLGAQNQQQQQQQPQAQPALTFGGFGTQQTNNTAGTTGGGFGTGTGLFGGNTGGFGGFGASQTQGQNQTAAPAAGGFSFGKPATTSTFGGGFNFGQSQQQNQQQPQQQQQSFLGQSQQLQPIQTSIDQNPYGQFGNTPVFANVQPAAANANAASTEGPIKKQPAMSVSYRRPTRASPAKLQLRGFANSTSSPSLNSRFGSSYSSPVTPLVSSVRSSTMTGSPSLTLDLSRGLVEGLTLSPQAFASRPSVKKLVIDNKKPGENVSMFSRNRTATPASNGPREDSIKSIKPNLSATADASRAGSPAPRPSSVAMQNNRSRTSNGNSGTQSVKSDKPLTADGREPKDEEWYSIPSLRDLKAMSLEELSNVQNLKVGRKGMAEIAYTEPVDLTELPSLDDLFGESVSIKYVYKGQKRRIELGLVDVAETGQPYDGLERPAVVTVEQRFSKAKAGATSDTNTKIINEKHEVKLRKEVEANEHEFISWAPETGKLVFKVQHFSLYTYDVDGSDEGSESTISADEGSPGAGKRAQATQKKRRTRSDSPQSDTDSHVSSESPEPEDEIDDAPPQATLDDSMTELDDHNSDRSYSGTPEPRDRSIGLDDREQSDEDYRRRKRSVVVPTSRFAPTSRLRNLESPRKEVRRDSPSRDEASPQSARAHSEAPSQQPIAQRLGLQAKKLAVMQASFFHNAKPDNASLALDPTPSAAYERAPKQPFPRALAPVEQQTETSPHGNNDYLPYYKPLRKWKAVLATQSLAFEQEEQLFDAGLTSSRDVRASFGQRGQICHLGRIEALASLETSISLSRVVLAGLSPFEASTDHDVARKLLETQLEHTELASDDCELVRADCRSTLRFQNILSSFDAQDDSHEATLWRLAQVLFDEIDLRRPDDSSSEVIRTVTMLRRRDALSAWLRVAVKPSVESDLRALSGQAGTSSHTARIFTLLTGRQIERACQVALAEGDIRLATLLSQAGGDEESREDLQAQLASWRDSRVDPQVTSGYRKIYELLSGNINVSKGTQGNGNVDTCQDLNLSADLDWKRAFGLRLWYGDFENSIHGSLEDYLSDRANNDGVAKPLPEHLLTRNGRQSLLPDRPSIQDAVFELLTVFCDSNRPLDYALSPRSLTSCPLDYRPSWHLYQVLAKSLRIRDLEDVNEEGESLKAEEMTVSYACQLEAAGLWEWAAFVYLHLSQPQSRIKAIKELIARHVQDLDDSVITLLTDRLRIPQSYVDEAVTTYGN